MDKKVLIEVEVCYALAEHQTMLTLSINTPCTVKQAIELSEILEQFPQIDLAINKVGIFSKRVELEHLLQHGDRVEIYRPLLIDPKQARRMKAL